MNSLHLSRLARGITAFALVVIVIGAYVRLSDAGLGCPDWPGCYGHLDVPQTTDEVERAEQAFPHRPVETSKAWKEMYHRYFAGTLVILIVVLAIASYKSRIEPKQVQRMAYFLVGLVIFQALLGMWTVTLQVKPAIVTLHLLFGMATVSLLWMISLVAATGCRFSFKRNFTSLALMVLVIQIALGGWTSTNYAALACTAFPGCYQGEAWPAMDFAEGFVLWRGLGVNYEFGVLEPDARAAIHMTHRIGALVTLFVLAVLGWQGLKKSENTLGRYSAIAILVFLIIQIGLGINNIISSLPLLNAVAHNGVAALLLLSILAYNHSENMGLAQKNRN